MPLIYKEALFFPSRKCMPARLPNRYGIAARFPNLYGIAQRRLSPRMTLST